MPSLYRTTIVLAVFTAAGIGKASAIDSESQVGAVRAAEQFIRERGYDAARQCPEDLAQRDAQGFYDMQPHCQHYAASETHAFAVDESEIMWRVYFRKVPPTCYKEGESFRVVEVFRLSSPTGPRVVLKDIELFLPEEVIVLGPNKSMQPTCETHAADG